MFELLLSLVGNPRWQAQLAPAAKDMAHLAIGYMQVGDFSYH